MTTGKGSTRYMTATPVAKRSTAAKNMAAKKQKAAGRKYSPKASAFVEQEMKEMKQRKLKSGSSGKIVRNPKQAIAIGLSEARRSGARVPRDPRKAA